MNKDRRTRIMIVIDQLTQSIAELRSIKLEEDFARDNIPENMCDTERYTHSEECSDVLDEATDSIDEAITTLSDIV